MAFSEALAERIRQRLARRRNVEEKNMFGGVGFLLNGNMLVSVWKTSLIARLGLRKLGQLRRTHSHEARTFGSSTSPANR